MRLRTGGALAVIAGAVLAGTAFSAQAAELGFLEMLFGARPAPQQAAPAPLSQPESFTQRTNRRLGAGRRHLQTRYAALPIKIRAKEPEISARQVSIDMKAGATAALLKDETLRPGDIVVLNTGAKVFTGNPDKRHVLRDFEPAHTSRFVSKGTRKALAGLFTPVGRMPAQEARRMVDRSTPAPVATPIPAERTAMRVINPWQSGQ
ncbi:MAG: hypothetical protein INR70_32990 [Parafilimonas terrae]|jgi:hypothetical protein|nr:hypothetical protein [Parafilimonas terrae]